MLVPAMILFGGPGGGFEPVAERPPLRTFGERLGTPITLDDQRRLVNRLAFDLSEAR